MKKTSLVLLAMLCSTMLNGCNRVEITGSEAAKMLLAEERLDSGDLKNTSIVFKQNSQNKKIKKANSNINNLNSFKERYTIKEKSKTGTKVTKQGNNFTWNQFNEYSNAVSYFDSFINNIEKNTKNGATLIEEAKDKIDANNVWVKGLANDRLIQINANEDIVMKRDKDSYQIVKHTLTEDGVDSYDVFTGEKNGNYGARVKKVGDYRYEYSYISDDGSFEHYFIADKSRGYWVVYSPVNQTQFSTTILKDDMCYDLTTEIERGEIGAIRVITEDQKCDVLWINYNTFEFYSGSISNIESMTAVVSDDKIVNLEDYQYSTGEYDLLYNKDDGSYSSTGSANIAVNLKNGVTLKDGDTYANGKVTFSRALISGNADGMIGSFSVEVEGATIEEKISNLELFIKETGIIFVRDNNAIINSIKTAYADAVAATKSITWNDINIDSVEAYAKAYQKEREGLKTFVEKYNEVKDNTELSRNQQGKLDRNTTFPYITNSSFKANYSNNMINIESATARIDEFKLFEVGKKYNMQFALAQYDEENEGYFSIIPLNIENSAYVIYNGEKQLILSTNKISFAAPVPTIGTYELVTYIANEDGIRVSRPQPVRFDDVDNNEISIHNYTAQLYKTDENFLGFNSILNENVVLQIQEPKNQYTYEQLHQMLSVEAYKYGVIGSGNIEVLHDNNTWASLLGNETNLLNGTYRLAFTNKKNQQVYVSTTY